MTKRINPNSESEILIKKTMEHFGLSALAKLNDMMITGKNTLCNLRDSENVDKIIELMYASDIKLGMIGGIEEILDNYEKGLAELGEGAVLVSLLMRHFEVKDRKELALRMKVEHRMPAYWRNKNSIHTMLGKIDELNITLKDLKIDDKNIFHFLSKYSKGERWDVDILLSKIMNEFKTSSVEELSNILELERESIYKLRERKNSAKKILKNLNSYVKRNTDVPVEIKNLISRHKKTGCANGHTLEDNRTVSFVISKESSDIDTLIFLTMEELGLHSLDELANKFKVDPSTVSKWRKRNSVNALIKKIDSLPGTTASEIEGAEDIVTKYSTIRREGVNSADKLILEAMRHFKVSTLETLGAKLKVSAASLMLWKKENSIDALEMLTYNMRIPIGKLKKFDNPDNIEDVSDVLERLKVYFKTNTLSHLAEKMGIKYVTLHQYEKYNNMGALQIRIEKLNLLEDTFTPLMEKGQYFSYPARKAKEKSTMFMTTKKDNEIYSYYIDIMISNNVTTLKELSFLIKEGRMMVNRFINHLELSSYTEAAKHMGISQVYITQIMRENNMRSVFDKISASGTSLNELEHTSSSFKSSFSKETVLLHEEVGKLLKKTNCISAYHLSSEINEARILLNRLLNYFQLSSYKELGEKLDIALTVMYNWMRANITKEVSEKMVEYNVTLEDLKNVSAEVESVKYLHKSELLAIS